MDLRIYISILSLTAIQIWTPATCARPSIESALFVCGYALFKHEEIAMLFPPSQISMNGIKNFTAAEGIHRAALDSFCSHVDTYSACVRDNLFYFPKDILIKEYMDLDNFGSYFRVFCEHRKLIANQFQCTRIAVSGTSCAFGGVYGIIAKVSQMIRNPVSKKEFCSNVGYNLNCRVNFQLAPCDRRYAAIMKWIYNGLISKYCI